MIIKTKDFQKACKTLQKGVNDTELSTLTEILELKTVGKELYMNVTNKEFFLSIIFPLDHEEDFRATVKADLFIKLIDKITTNSIEFLIKNNNLLIKANGEYELEMMCDPITGDPLELTPIMIDNPTVSFSLSGEILQSILNYNSKELQKKETFSKPVQTMYYIDNEGCITFTTGACINQFQLPQPVRLLLNKRIVKLFKLFNDEEVDFILGYDNSPIDDTLVQTKVQFFTQNVHLTAIIDCNDDLLNMVPKNNIMKRATYEYAFNISVDTKEIAAAIDRLLLFTSPKENLIKSKITCDDSQLTIYSIDNQSFESINILNNNLITHINYSMYIDLRDLKTILDTIDEQDICMGFGKENQYGEIISGEAVCIKRKNIINIIPEMQ